MLCWNTVSCNCYAMLPFTFPCNTLEHPGAQFVSVAMQTQGLTMFVLLLQGHFQIMFNPKVSPLFQKKLSWGMRILYSSGVWSYLCAAISTPTFIVIPLVRSLSQECSDLSCH